MSNTIATGAWTWYQGRFKVQMGLISDSNTMPPVKIGIAACENLNVDILLDYQTHEFLTEQVKLYSLKFV